VGKLLDMISRRSAKAYDAFIEALVETDQEHVAEVLDRNKTAALVQIRDARRSQNSHAQASSYSEQHSALAPSAAPIASATSSSSAAARGMSSHTNIVPSVPALTPSGICLSFLCNFQCLCFISWYLDNVMFMFRHHT